MDPVIALVAAVVGYLFGCISFARIIARLVAPQQDVTQTEMAVPGTEEKMPLRAVSGTAVSIHLGAKYGCLTALLDMAKVALPVAVFRFAFPGQPYLLITAITGIMGHNWPVFYGFKGGSGLSPTYGGMLVISPVGTIVTAFGGMALGLFVLRNVVVSYLAGLWLMIPWLWFTTYDPWYLAYGIIVNVLFFIAMIPEIKTVREYEKRGIGTDVASGMDMTPMGRMLGKMMKRMGLDKSNKADGIEH
jgi:acyl phosphate:glycerol-3-phosphate acyltransferase